MEIMKAMAAIACSHKQLVKTDENTVCSNCGMVVNELDYSTEGMHDSGRSKMNLFETKAIGTRNDLPKTKENMQLHKYFRGTAKDEKGRRDAEILSKFSNTCDKLGLSRAASDYAWGRFEKVLPSHSRRKMAETACWALHESCRKHGISVSAEKIRRAILVNFNRKKLPNMISILYAHMEHGSPKEEYQDEKYYFEVNLKKLLHGRTYSKPGYARMSQDAWAMYKDVFVRGNYNQRARRAISHAFGVRL